MNEPEKYDGKTVMFRGQLHRRPDDPADRFAAGRFAMVCCAEDISFLAFFCIMERARRARKGGRLGKYPCGYPYGILP